MKKIFVLAAAGLSLLGAQAKVPYELVNDPKGYSYIQINEDVDSFAFTSDFVTLGDGSKIGFFIYPDGLEGQALERYNANVKVDSQFGKDRNNDQVNLGSLKAGDRVGFYLEQAYKNRKGVITRYNTPIRFWNFQWDKNGTPYIAFNKIGSGNLNMMSIENISIKVGNSSAPAGQPLPGALAMLVLGGLGIGAAKLSGKKKA